MTEILESVITAICIDIGKNSFSNRRPGWTGAVALRRKWSRGQVEARGANLPRCLISCMSSPNDARVRAYAGRSRRRMTTIPWVSKPM